MERRARTIQIRVSNDQYERIRNKAMARGYKTLTAFMLHLALEKDLLFEQRFDEIYHIVSQLGTGNKKV